MIRKATAFLIVLSLFLQQSGWPQIVGTAGIPVFPGGNFIDRRFRPLHVRYLAVNPSGDFELLLARGDEANLSSEQIDASAGKLMRYFRIGVRLPDSTFWVNLRPDGEEEIIDPLLEQTDMGRIMLEADLQLKRDLARMTDPDTIEGKHYWEKLYAKAEALFGAQEDMEIPTLARPWIVPGEIVIGENERGAYVYKATLSVMLEQDYLKDSAQYNFSDPRSKQLNEYAVELIRSSILPRLGREINSAKRYASLRQVYYSLILAQWYKQRFKIRAADSKDITGLTSAAAWSKKTYFEAYRKSFQQGEYNKSETVGSQSALVIRQYASGGLALSGIKKALNSRIVWEEEGTIDPQRFFNWLGGQAINRVFPGEAEKSDRRKQRLEAIKGQQSPPVVNEQADPAAGWQEFLQWEHGLALFEKTERGLQRIGEDASVQRENLETQQIQSQAEDLLTHGDLYRQAAWFQKNQGANPRGMLSEEVVLLRVDNKDRTFVAVVSVDDLVPAIAPLSRDDMIVRVKEFKSRIAPLAGAKIPALDGHEEQYVLFFQGRPASGKSTGIETVSGIYSELIEQFNPELWIGFDGENFHNDLQGAANHYKNTGKIPSVAIDSIVDTMLKNKYSDREEKFSRVFKKLRQLKQTYPRLDDFIIKKRSGVPDFITNTDDQRAWLEVVEQLGPDPQGDPERSPWTAVFTNEEIMSVEKEAAKAFTDIRGKFIERGVSFISEDSGFDIEREREFREKLQDRYLFSVRRIVYKIDRLEDALEKIKTRYEDEKYVRRNGIYMKRFENSMRQYYDEKMAFRHAELERKGNVIIHTDMLDIDGSKRIVSEHCSDVLDLWQQQYLRAQRKKSLDKSSAAAETSSKPRTFALRVETLKTVASGQGLPDSQTLENVFDGMFRQEIIESMRAGELEGCCKNLFDIAGDGMVNQHIRAEAISALSNAYRVALNEGAGQRLQEKLYGYLFSLSTADDGLLAVQLSSSPAEETLRDIPDKRLGYLLIMSLAQQPKRLLSIVEDRDVSIRHRLYAAMVLIGSSGDAGLLKKRFIVGGKNMTLAEIGAQMIRRESGPDRMDDYSLFANSYLQDEELAMCCFAVFLQIADAFPELCPSSNIPASLKDIVYAAKAATYANYAYSALFIGGEKNFLASYDFWGIIAHELGHNLIPDRNIGRGQDEQAISELMCELLAAAVSQHAGFDMPRLAGYWADEYRRRDDVENDFHWRARGQMYLLSQYESCFGESYYFAAGALFITGCALLNEYDQNRAGLINFISDMIEKSSHYGVDQHAVKKVSYIPTDLWVFPGEGRGKFMALRFKLNLKKRFAGLMQAPDKKINDLVTELDNKKRLQAGRPDGVGGIDFRSLSAATPSTRAFGHAGINAGAWRKAAELAEGRCVDEVCAQIDALLEGDVLPDDQLFRQYIIAGLRSRDGVFQAASARARIARILWLEEEQGVVTPEPLFDALVIVTAADPFAAMNAILSDQHV